MRFSQPRLSLVGETLDRENYLCNERMRPICVGRSSILEAFQRHLRRWQDRRRNCRSGYGAGRTEESEKHFGTRLCDHGRRALVKKAQTLKNNLHFMRVFA